MTLRTAALAATLLAAFAAQAQTSVKDAWVRATVPHQGATGAFMVITSAQGGELVGAASPVAGTVEVHEMKMDGDVMKMAAIDKLALPAGQAVELKPGSYHVMLMNLKKEIKAGEAVPVTLTVKGADGKTETVSVQAEARAMGAAASAAAHQHQH